MIYFGSYGRCRSLERSRRCCAGMPTTKRTDNGDEHARHTPTAEPTLNAIGVTQC